MFWSLNQLLKAERVEIFSPFFKLTVTLPTAAEELAEANVS